MNDETNKDLNYSRKLDVHRWSDFAEVNSFVDKIYADHFANQLSKHIGRKHLKVILLDLYVAWKDDPDLCIAYHRDVDKYNARSRYNKLKISKKTIDVVDLLIKADFVNHKIGFYDTREDGSSFMSRMWPAEKLISMFKKARFDKFDVGFYRKRESIVLKDHEKNEVDYKQDTRIITQMRMVLDKYNELLARTHIDVAILDNLYVETKIKNGKTKKIPLNLSNKFTRRIFNNNSWKKGGRFYGGFWQRIPSEYRQHIRINDKRTVEVDYSGHHISLLYANIGKNYWVENGFASDPYAVEVKELSGWSENQKREIAKTTVLVAVNASNEKNAFNAIRLAKAEYDLPEDVKLTDKLLKGVLDALKGKHPLIADKLCSGAGIDLQYMDSQITAKLIQHFTGKEVPILSIHDSYIVPEDFAIELRDKMEEVWGEVTGLPDLVEGWLEKLNMAQAKIKQNGYSGELDDPEEHKEMKKKLESGYVSQRYREGINEHIKYMESFNK